MGGAEGFEVGFVSRIWNTRRGCVCFECVCMYACLCDCRYIYVSKCIKKTYMCVCALLCKYILFRYVYYTYLVINTQTNTNTANGSKNETLVTIETKHSLILPPPPIPPQIPMNTKFIIPLQSYQLLILVQIKQRCLFSLAL